MSVRMQFHGMATLCLVLAGLLLSAPAGAVYFQGGYDVGGVLRFQKWGLKHFDNNNDGRVDPGEGLEIFIETGPRGFSASQVQQIEEAMAVWSAVPTSYASFRIGGSFQDPVTPGSQDGRVTYTLAFPDEPEFSVLPPGFEFTTVVTATLDDTVVTINGVTQWIGGGTILDADMVVDGQFFLRETGGTPFDPFRLVGVTVNNLGWVLGMIPPPPFNLREDNIGLPTENAVFWHTGGDGVPRRIGLTSSLYLVGFLTLNEVVDLPSGRVTIPRSDGFETLAPEDISAVSFLYPRGDQSRFFNFSHRARTQGRVDLASLPLPNALVTAWIDTDGNPNTARLPFASTLTGLYENDINDSRQGVFDFINLWKRIETEGPGLIDATYTFTVSPLNETGPDRLAPVGYTVETLNRIEGSTSEVIDEFFSETFNEFGNIIDLSNREVGTPMLWDEGRRRLVSADTGRTLDEILPGRTPMFGDGQTVCPFNVIVGGTGGDGVDTGDGTVPTVPGLPLLTALRGFRDDSLLQSALGAAFVDAYYHAAPGLAAFIEGSPVRMQVARLIFHMLAVSVHYRIYLLAPVLVLALALWRVRRRAARTALPAILAALALFSMGGIANAQIVPLTTADLTGYSDLIIQARVVAVESYWERRGSGDRIMTNISVEVLETVKGPANKQSDVTFTQPGGEVDGVATRTTAFPTFAEGEEATLFLARSAALGWILAGGYQGKLPVTTDTKDGVQYIQPQYPAQVRTLRESAADIAAAKGLDPEKALAEPGVPRVTLEDYLDHVRQLVWAEEQESPAEE